jgi:fructose-1,6-bisphosphatase/inositol monophosphatase family enzyme
MDDLELAASLVRAAGTLAAQMRAGGQMDLDAAHKTSLSDIVTAADHAAEALVVERLRALRPDDSIVGEEGAEHVGTSGRTWFIDPVDGTWNFFHGLDWWCSAIALSGPDDVILGAIHHPAGDATYAGGPGLPATRNGVPMEPLVDRPTESVGATTYLQPSNFSDDVGGVFGRAVARVATLRFLGSGSMDATAVAQGTIGVSFQHSVPDWDRLPGEAILRSLGGERREVKAGGVTWNVMGLPTPVRDVATALAG